MSSISWKQITSIGDRGRFGIVWVDWRTSCRGNPLSSGFPENSSRSRKGFGFDSRTEGAEGVVFKRLSAPYKPGRPNSGGDQFKYKFVETASVVVTAINACRSVGIGVWQDEELRPAGNVTIPPDAVPAVGSIVEVRYLYAMPGSGALYQPVYRGERDDITSAECTRSQLKFLCSASAGPNAD